MGQFKTLYHPYTQVQLTNSNCLFVNTLTGNDSTGSGTRENPYATVTRASSKSTVLINGYSFETAIGGNTALIGDNKESGVSTTSGYVQLISLSTNNPGNGFFGSSGGDFYSDLIVKGAINPTTGGYAVHNIINSFINTLQCNSNLSNNWTTENDTIINFNNYSVTNICFLKNDLFVSSVDLYNYSSRSNVTYYPIFQYCLFRKAATWKWNGNTISTSTYSGTTHQISDCNSIEDLTAFMYRFWYGASGTGSTEYLAMVSAGTDRAYFQALFPTETSSPLFYVGDNGQTCKLVEDRPSVNGHVHLFNRYNGDVPVDYSLALHSDNVALYMSSTGSYVGCYQANVNNMTFDTILDVNTDGTDNTGTTATLLLQNVSDGSFYAGIDSTQVRNRVRSNVLSFPRGFSFVGMQSQLTSGLGSRFYFGKFQPYNTTTAPTIPMETVECIPYDSLTTPASFPRWSANFNGVCQMFYKTTANTPILFSDLKTIISDLVSFAGITLTNTSGSTTVTASATLASKVVIGDILTINGQTVTVTNVVTTTLTVDEAITNANTNTSTYSFGIYCDKSRVQSRYITAGEEYADWAVTNADYEQYLLLRSFLGSTIKSQNIPIKYVKLELNFNYAE